MRVRNWMIPCVLAVVGCFACKNEVKTVDNCGDGIVDPGEDCDGGDFGGVTCLDHGFYTGVLACRSDCTLDLSGCAESCGDGVIQTAREQCEDQDFQGVTCQSLGYTSGGLVCTAGCQRDETGCIAQCGDGVVDTGQDCDDGGTENGDGCSNSCTLEPGWACVGSPSVCTAICGDHEVVGAEVCDDGVNDGAYGGCMPGCGALAAFCGDGSLDDGDGEVCDGEALGGVTCQTLGYAAGSVTCAADCGAVQEDGCMGRVLASTRYGAGNNESLFALAVDGQGNVLMTGAFSLSTDFGGGAVNANGTYDSLYVAKVDPSGALLWLRAYSNQDASQGNDIAVDAQGAVYVTGFFSGTMVFGAAGSRVSAGGRDGFLLKLDADGNPLWVRRFGGSGNDAGNGVAVSSSGKPFVAGAVSGGAVNIFFEGYVAGFSGAGGTDIFVFSTSVDGSLERFEHIGTSADEAATDVALDANDQPTFVGTYRGPLSFGGLSLANAGDTDVFIMRMDPLLDTPFWLKRIASAGADVPMQVSVTADGRVAVAAAFNAQAECGTASPVPVGSQDALVARLESNGTFLWCRPLGASGWENILSVVLDAAGHVFMTGLFAGQATLGTTILTSAGLHDVFLVRLDAQGDPVWGRRFGGPSTEGGYALGLWSGGMVLGGAFNGSLDLGPGVMTAAGTNGNVDLYLAWLVP